MSGTTNRDRLARWFGRLWAKVPFGVQVGVYCVLGAIGLVIALKVLL